MEWINTNRTLPPNNTFVWLMLNHNLYENEVGHYVEKKINVVFFGKRINDTWVCSNFVDLVLQKKTIDKESILRMRFQNKNVKEWSLMFNSNNLTIRSVLIEKYNSKHTQEYMMQINMIKTLLEELPREHGVDKIK